MRFYEATRFTTLPQMGPQTHLLRTLTVSPPDDGIVVQALRLPAVDFLTGASPIILRPLAGGMSRLYAMRHNEMRADHQKRQLMHLAVNVIGTAVVTYACRMAAPLLGAHALTLSASLNVLLILSYLYHALKQRVEMQGLGAARMLSEAYDEMRDAAPVEEMSERCCARGHAALEHARVLGVTDPRLSPAAEQYAAVYNAKFGSLANVRLP